ncbi:cholinesterase 1-like [Lytechinus variegatus]|uniref:cholinesterase 1-like n=1 Tax=Lytechinus variegatus TaxID=7654 RepID=UPI001BB25F24|nr:cholinesterase 1-like [Lytechinus variegatus]
MAPQSFYIYLAIIIVVVPAGNADVTDDDERLVVQTSTATFRGKRIEVNPYLLPNFQGSAAAYTRIPYAQPPVDELRFRRPVPVVIEGEFDATRVSVACAQAIQPPFVIDMESSEDCLTVDVFVPEPKPSSAAVMVWIHGGGYSVGAGSIPGSLPVPLAVMNDVIVVTVNYRLNVFGFLSLGEDDVSEANVGMLDQRQALVWVQENIAAFGGDPSRVTIFGESAGGMSVSFHVLSPMSKGLFSGAIFQSGVLTSQWSYSTEAEGEETVFLFGRALNCSQENYKELVQCLREIPADAIVDFIATNPMEMFTNPPRPVVDGAFIPRDPREMYAAGEVNQVTVMTGCLSEEGNMFIMPPDLGLENPERPVFNRTSFEGVISMFMKSSDELLMDTATTVYMKPEEMVKAEPEYSDVAADFMGDYFFVCPNFLAADQLSDAGITTYSYMMTHRPSVSMWGKQIEWLGATHGEDLPYTLGNPFMLESLDPEHNLFLIGLFNEQEVEMAIQIMKYWSNFAKTGNPNLSCKESKPDPNYPLWETYSKEIKSYKELSMTFENRQGIPNPQSCMFQNHLLPKLQKNAAELARLNSLLEEKVVADSGKTCEDPDSCPEE